MCGRYALIDGREVLATFPMLQQAVVEEGAFARLPQYNAAPMGMMPVVFSREGELRIESMKWWLVPHWAPEPKTAFSTFNAKGETLRASKLFSPYFKGSRCLVPADAFYEWKKVMTEGAGKGLAGKQEEKHPMCIRMEDGSPFLFAGLFSIWKDPHSEKREGTFTIITTKPNEALSSIHNRMPVILEEKNFEEWVNRENKDVEKLERLLRPYPSGGMVAYRVSKMINSSKNNSPQCLDPEEREEIRRNREKENR